MIVTDLSNSFHPVPKNIAKNRQSIDKKSSKQYKNSTIKKKTSKLAKLEKERYSIFTKDLEICYICGKKKDDLHEIFGGRNRKLSMIYGIVIPLCRKCHEKMENDESLKKKWHEVAQKTFEKHYKTKNFMQIFGKNFL